MDSTPHERVGTGRLLIEGAGVVDAEHVATEPGRPGALLLEPAAGRLGGWTVLAAGDASDVARHPKAPEATRVSLPDDVLVPGFVNAHAHLDLTAIGPRPHDPADGFVAWIERIVEHRRRNPGTARDAVFEGVRRSRAGGVAVVGDIAGGPDAVLAAWEADADIEPFLELIGTGPRRPDRLDAFRASFQTLRDGAAGRPLNASPHAPYSTHPDLYRSLREDGAFGRLTTHAAESIEESEFIARGTGPFRGFLERFGLWEGADAAGVGAGRTPIEHALDALGPDGLIAHANDASDRDIELLASSGASVVWCPRAHRAFDHESTLGPHRWRDMLAAGIPVALGTDSIVSLPPEEADAITPLDDARLLWREGERDARLLLGAITAGALRALGRSPEGAAFSPGPLAGVAAVRVGPGSAALAPAERVMAEALGQRLILPGDLP